MQIDIRNFVDVNITHHSTAVGVSTRDTTVLLVVASGQDFIVDSYAAVIADHATWKAAAEDEELDYIKIYFANGGKKLHVLSANATENASLAAQLKTLDDAEIIVAYPHSTATLLAAMALLNADPTVYGVKLKKAVVRTSATVTANAMPNVYAKYSTKGETQACIAAYLSKIDVNKSDVVKDYDFTIENLTRIEDGEEVHLYEDSDDALFKRINTANENVDMPLAGQIRNLGGNAKDGADLVNDYMLVLLQQTVSEKILSVLTDKLKGELGVAALHTAIAQELNKYVADGYLTTDKIWTDDTLQVSYNGKTYDIIEKNTPLLLGYQIKILPYAALTAEDKALHKTPPIYLVIADSYHIRYVALTGEVF